ncbi:MAG: phosphatidylglycerophosphatase A [Opitutaceae bacterium]|nr:phosphatidylglycerophosphatase A [Opitutaceae bacterium]
MAAAAHDSGGLRACPTWLIVGLARVGPFGRFRPGPGTWGTAVGLAYFYFAFSTASTLVLAAGSAAAALFAVAICGEAEKRLGRTDPGEIILDELVAVPFCFLGWSEFLRVAPAWAVLLAGFALFRLFDIAKPFGIRSLQHLPGGWGVVADDIVAALYANLVLHAAYHLWRVLG